MALGLQGELQLVRGDYAVALQINTEALEVCRAMNWPINCHPAIEIFHDRVKLLRRLDRYEDALLLIIDLEKKSEDLGSLTACLDCQGQLLEQSILSYQIFRFLVIVVGKQMIEQFFVNGHTFSLLRVGLSTTPEWPFTQTLLHPCRTG